VLRYYDGKVNHVQLTFSSSANRPEPAGGGTRNILMVGSDTRAGTGGEFGQVEGQRADTTILAHLDADGSTTLISFPRDLWVQIPAYTSGDGSPHGARKAKLNSAFALGGPSLLVQTIEGLTGIRVDHYLQVDFVGFQDITDALGGVTVCVRQLPPSLQGRFNNLDDKMSGWHGKVGDNLLTGAQALAFVRQRYGLPEGDLDRIRRQQQFLGAVFRSVTSTGTVVNPAKLVSVVDAATSALTLDDGTALSDLRLLALRMQAIGSGGVTFTTVPAKPGNISGQSVLLINDDELTRFLAGITGGSTSGAAGRSPAPGGAAPTNTAPTNTAPTNTVPVSTVPVSTVLRGDDVALVRPVRPAHVSAAAQAQAEAAPAATSCTY
jgi:LCP family protein required for cell wall assembly